MKSLPLVLSFVLLSTAGIANAGGLQAEEQWDALNKTREDKTKLLNQTCGTKIASKIDRASFDGVEIEDAPLMTPLRDSMTAVHWLCTEKLGKKAVADRITTIVVKRSKNGTRYQVTGSTLTIHIDLDARNPTGKKPDFGYTWLQALRETL